MLSINQHSEVKSKYLSGGMKRKLCTALALLNDPKIIFMDELSNGVDPISRKNIYLYLKQL